MVAGDFDDMESAMYAATKCGRGGRRGDQPPSGRSDLLDPATLGGSPGWMIATLRPDGLIELRPGIGRFGEVDRERHLLAAVARAWKSSRGISGIPGEGPGSTPAAAPADPP